MSFLCASVVKSYFSVIKPVLCLASGYDPQDKINLFVLKENA